MAFGCKVLLKRIAVIIWGHFNLVSNPDLGLNQPSLHGWMREREKEHYAAAPPQPHTSFGGHLPGPSMRDWGHDSATVATLSPISPPPLAFDLCGAMEHCIVSSAI